MEQPDIVVSNNLKRLREEHNLSYTQLADLTGVSKSMLRQIEIGDSSPTINTLWKIANGLEVPFTMLVNPPMPNVSQRGFKDREPLTGTTEGYRLYPLVLFETTRSFELYYVEIERGISLDADPHKGNVEEVVMVIEGELEIQVDQQTTTVVTDEMLRFDANHPHHYRNTSNSMCRLLMVISYSG